jgi:hypothetical protein
MCACEDEDEGWTGYISLHRRHRRSFAYEWTVEYFVFFHNREGEKGYFMEVSIKHLKVATCQ